MDDKDKNQDSDKLYAGKYKTVEELEKAYKHANDLISKGQHKDAKGDDTPPKQDKPAQVDTKAIEKAVAEALKQRDVQQKVANVEAVKKLIKSEPDAALSLKKALWTEDGKQEKEYLEKIEKGDVSMEEVNTLIARGKELEEPPSFLDKVLKEGNNKSDFDKMNTEYLDLLDNPSLYNKEHPDHKKSRDRMTKLQETLGLPKEDFSALDEWDTGMQGEETTIDPDGY